MLERLQKIIARAGIASRRHAEELIKSGLVTVNGQTITELGSKADESKDHIKVQGKLLRPETERVYLLLNKPPEVVSTMIDPEGRRSLSDMLHGVAQRVFPVGRLEYHSLGLVFLTNDGELANLMLKAHHLPQTYNLKLKTLLTFDETAALEQSTGARITRIKGKDAPWYEVTLSEARRDALRNRLFQTGHPVEKIKRVKIGNLALESLTPGNYRPLSDAEVNTLRKMIQPGATQSSSTATQSAADLRRSHRSAATNGNRNVHVRNCCRHRAPSVRQAPSLSTQAQTRRSKTPQSTVSPARQCQLRARIKISGTRRTIVQTSRLRQLSSRARHKSASKIRARTIPRVPISNRAHQPQAVARRNRHSQNHSAQNHTAKNPVAPGNPAHLSGGKAPEARNHTAAESHSENSARTPLVVPIKIPTTIARSNQNPKPPGAAPNRRNPPAAVAPTQAEGPAQNSENSHPPAAAASPAPRGNHANPRNRAHSAARKVNSRN